MRSRSTKGPLGTRRPGPHAHDFAPRLFLAYLDVDALPASLDPLPGWSARRAAPVHFRREDFLDGAPTPLGDAVRDLVQTRLGRRPDGPVYLLAQLRTFGWEFNPMSVYYCWKPDAPELDAPELDAVVLEVTNTPWGERHWYVFDAPAGADRRRHAQGDARLAVPPDGRRLPRVVDAPSDSLRLDIVVVRGETDRLLRRTRAQRERPLNRRTAVTVLLRYPLMPLRVSLMIYRKALGLFASRVPLYRHPARSAQEVGA